jgi:hypothetical protein
MSHDVLERAGTRRNVLLQERAEEALHQVLTVEDHLAGAAGEVIRRCRHEKARILGDAREEIAAYRKRERASRREHGVRSEVQRLARQTEFVRVAQGFGVDTDALFALNEYARSQLDLILHDGDGTGTMPLCHYGEYDHGVYVGGGGFSQPQPQLPEKNCITFAPPYPGMLTWAKTHLEGDSKLKVSQSFFDAPTATSGGEVRIEDWDADDYDWSKAYQENGIITLYETQAIGVLKIKATLQCVSFTEYIDTENEFGWSDSSIGTGSIARCGTFVDDDAAIQLQGAGIDGIGYSGNGDQPPYPSPPSGAAYPGKVVGVSFLSGSVFPAGQLVGVYVGTRHQVKFWVNDVSVNVSCAGKWFVKEVTVCQI